MEPWITVAERDLVNQSITDGWVGPAGPFVEKFETSISSFLSRETISVSNGSVAIILALIALGIRPGDEVIVPDLSYAATASSVIHVGARPVFADVHPETWTLSLDGLMARVSDRTRAVIVVHSYGVPAEIREIVEFCAGRGIRVIEDVAEAFSGEVGGQKLGTFGDIGTFSFFANKLVTTGEGGAVAADDPQLVERLRLLRGQGMDPTRRYVFLEPGFNFRMGSLQAALGVGQMSRLSEILEKRRQIEEIYSTALKGIVRAPILPAGSKRAPWIYTGTIASSSLEPIQVARALALDGFETRPVFYPLSSMPAFSRYAGDHNPVSSLISSRSLSLPSSHLVSIEQVLRIKATFERLA